MTQFVHVEGQVFTKSCFNQKALDTDGNNIDKITLIHSYSYTLELITCIENRFKVTTELYIYIYMEQRLELVYIRRRSILRVTHIILTDGTDATTYGDVGLPGSDRARTE